MAVGEGVQIPEAAPEKQKGPSGPLIYKIGVVIYAGMRYSSRFTSAIHFGGLPRPVQVSPVDGLRYFGATLVPALEETALRFPKTSSDVSPNSATSARALAVASDSSRLRAC